MTGSPSRLPWRAADGGILLDLRVTPRSGRDALDGVDSLSSGQAVLKARVRALPADGEANAAIIALVAKALGLPKSAVSIARGGTSRVKTLLLTGDAHAITQSLEKIAREAK